MSTSNLSERLQSLVNWSVTTLGRAIEVEYGKETFDKIEELRVKHKNLRGLPPTELAQKLTSEMEEFKTYSDIELNQLCNSYTIMLELINRCENSYRAFRLNRRQVEIPENRPRSIIFVLTAHPTEARGPELLGIFENIQNLLIEALKESEESKTDELLHLLVLSLKMGLARKSKPTVSDEPRNIYSYILNPDILEEVVKFQQKGVSVSFRSWVGGDKDGHPGVDENALLDSLQLSRTGLLNNVKTRLDKFESKLNLLKNHDLLDKFTKLKISINLLSALEDGDGQKIVEVKEQFEEVFNSYKDDVGLESPDLVYIKDLMYVFPALVVPLELREDSEVVAEALDHGHEEYAISKMLNKVKTLSEGFVSKWYARGFILSMVEATADIQNGLKLMKEVFGSYEIPVTPLFENEKALSNGVEILTSLFKSDSSIAKSHQEKWGSRYEVMVGYSDSSKENGVLPSRYMIAKALRNIEATLTSFDLTPVFFHGSGGSVERGGGSIKEQTQWWPKSSLSIFKATTQGEMVARNFGNRYIFSRQVEQITNQLSTVKDTKTIELKSLDVFTEYIRQEYSNRVSDEDFVKVIEEATPYSFLHHLKIGSRPTKRTTGDIRKKLRAIPWILCWTQTRVLFPTWWGIGSAWDKLDPSQKIEILTHGRKNPLLTSFSKVLGFTLSKVDLGVWKLYLDNSKLDEKLKAQVYEDFVAEFEKTTKFFEEFTGEEEYLWFRPWLRQSIHLRSSMIHLLNLIQLESLRRNDPDLLRDTVTGVACGMLTTG